MKWYNKTQFALFRIILGVYLCAHFVQLIADGTEVFSNQGVINDTTLLPGYGKLPVVLFEYDGPLVVNLFLWSLLIASVCFTIGKKRRWMSIWIFYGWMSLLNRNPFISNPSLGYVGWLLLACTLIPEGERVGFMLMDEEREDEKKNGEKWEVPDILFYGAWIVVGVSYTMSGLDKLKCQTWKDGTALHYVLTGPLVRQENSIVSFILQYPLIINCLTWGSLFMEISFMFLGVLYRTRCIYWIMSMGFHLGILCTVNFSDLTLGMMMIHLFTFDASWFECTRKYVEEYDNYEKIIEHDINHMNDFNKKPLVEALLDDINIDTDDDKSYRIINTLMYLLVAVITFFVIESKGGVYESMKKITQLTLDMYWGFGICVVILGILMILERIFPDQKLEHVRGWWHWVFIINVFQLFAVILASFTWEDWLQNTSYFKNLTEFHLRDHCTPFIGGFIAYVLVTWLFYWWHKARHEVYFLWILFHQFHHSPSRIETITSFYKHPLEIIVDSQILAIVLYSVLGLSNESSVWLSIFSATGEYFYHMNIKTPRWIGYLMQRPESHRCHHRRNSRRHCPNYSDFPLWDILGGTYENPVIMNDPTGFHSEQRRVDMLLFKDVVFSGYDAFSDFKKFKTTVRRYMCYALVLWGSLNSVAFITHTGAFREIGFATVSSPLPLVFTSFKGVETYSTAFLITVNYPNGTQILTTLGTERYGMLRGSYNRKNVYGVVFSHGPFFDTPNLIAIRQSILRYAVCDPGTVIKEFGLSGGVDSMSVDVIQMVDGKKVGELNVQCNLFCQIDQRQHAH